MENQLLKYKKPQNNFEFLKWVILDPYKTERYWKKLSYGEIFKQRLNFFFKTYLPISILLYFTFSTLVCVFNWPESFPNIFTDDIHKNWDDNLSFYSMLKIWLGSTFFLFIFYICAGLMIFHTAFYASFILNFKKNIGKDELKKFVSKSNLDVNLVFWFSCYVSIVGFKSTYISLLYIGFNIGLFVSSYALYINKEKSVHKFISNWSIVIILSSFLIFYTFGYLKNDLYFKNIEKFVCFSFAYLFASLNLHLFPLILIKRFRKTSLNDNIYITASFFPSFFNYYDKRLIKEANKNPYSGLLFYDFILKNRPFKKKLACLIYHSTVTGYWKNTNKLDRALMVYFGPYDEKYSPSPSWLKKLNNLEDGLTSFEQQSNILYKKQAFTKCVEILNELFTMLDFESFIGKEYYIESITYLKNLAFADLLELEEVTKSLQPISPNPFMKGSPLTPEHNKSIFLGREEIKDVIAQKVQNSKIVPLLLLFGQRRVGKTSLLKFLEVILGIGFKIVVQDMQSNHCRDFNSWLLDLRDRLNNTFHFKEKEKWKPSNDWLVAWSEFQDYVFEIAKKEQRKIIIAFDEYQDLHTKIFSKEPEKAIHLLNAMRSFSQHQRKVVFLFIGATRFSELKAPNWSEVFVNSELIRIDYLEKKDSLQLIKEPSDDYLLKYEEGLPEFIYEQTNGHPHLLQSVCSELTEYANLNLKKQLTFIDFEIVLKNKIIERETQPFSVFWEQFCAEEAMKETVLDICYNRKPKSRKCIIMLKEHRFIIENNGAYKMRVPLFEKWVKEFGY